jgi:hypothetical protein
MAEKILKKCCVCGEMNRQMHKRCTCGGSLIFGEEAGNKKDKRKANRKTRPNWNKLIKVVTV